MKLSKWFVVITISFLFLIECPFPAFGQETGPSGEQILRCFTPSNKAITIDYGFKGLNVSAADFIDRDLTPPRSFLNWNPPRGSDIAYFCEKTYGSGRAFILLTDGSIYETFGIMTDGIVEYEWPKLLSKGNPTDEFQLFDQFLTFKKMVGDDLYAISNFAVFVSRDSAATWKADTAGVGPGLYYDVAVDTSQYAWLAHSTGLWRQHPDSNTWRKISSFPKSSATTVFIDRRNSVLAGSSQQVYVSANAGSTWTIDTTGLGGQTVTMFCDDAFGNLYAMSKTHIWKSAGGTQSWSRIDQPFSLVSNDPSISQLFNAISGDTLLFAATVFGGYLSPDRGATWLRDSLQLPAGSVYGLAKISSGKILTSTNLGVFAKNSPAADWSKVFPSQGYLAASPLFLDGSGSLYTLGVKVNQANPNSVRANWKSTDGGTTWNPDTLGLGAIGGGQNQIYWVDESGGQHLAGYDTPAKMYNKSPGKAWAADISGYTNNTLDYPTAFGSDKRGNLYAGMLNLGTNVGSLFRRAIAAGSWVADTAGLAGAQVYWITVDRSGTVVLGTTSGVYRRNGSSWTRIPSPPGLGGYNAFVVSVDSTGAIVAGFSTLSGFNYAWRGVYATKNNGTSWTYLGLDSLSVRGLVSYGDTTYAYTYADGFYKLRSPAAVASSVVEIGIPAKFELEQNYPNPFNPTTIIRFSVPQRNRYLLKIFDVLGREIVRLLDADLEAGVHQVQFDASKYSSGVYFYQLQAGGAVLSRKLVLLK